MAIYHSRKVTSAAQILPLISFWPVSSETLGYDQNVNYEQMQARWEILFKSYLAGAGHPNGQPGLSENIIAHSACDPAMRARLFVLALTASQYMPLDQHLRSLQVCIQIVKVHYSLIQSNRFISFHKY